MSPESTMEESLFPRSVWKVVAERLCGRYLGERVMQNVFKIMAGKKIIKNKMAGDKKSKDCGFGETYLSTRRTIFVL